MNNFSALKTESELRCMSTDSLIQEVLFCYGEIDYLEEETQLLKRLQLKHSLQRGRAQVERDNELHQMLTILNEGINLVRAANIEQISFLSPSNLPDGSDCISMANWLVGSLKKLTSSAASNTSMALKLFDSSSDRLPKYRQNTQHPSKPKVQEMTLDEQITRKKAQIEEAVSERSKAACSMAQSSGNMAQYAIRIQKLQRQLESLEDKLKSDSHDNPSGKSAKAAKSAKSGTDEKIAEIPAAENAAEKRIRKAKCSKEHRPHYHSSDVKSSIISGVVVPLIKMGHEGKAEFINPLDGRKYEAWLCCDSSRLRVYDDITMANIRRSACTVKLKPSEKINEYAPDMFEVSPASSSDLAVFRRDGSGVCKHIKITSDEIKDFYRKYQMADSDGSSMSDNNTDDNYYPLPPENERRQALKADKTTLDKLKAENRAGYSDELLNRLIIYKDRVMFDPLKFCGYTHELYSMRPMLCGSSLSQGSVVNILNVIATGRMAKSRVWDMMSGLGLEISRQQFISNINIIIRMFLWRTALYHRDIMVEHNEILQADETTLRVKEHMREGRHKSYTWLLCSGPKEEYQGAFFLAAKTREAPEFYKLIGVSPKSPPEKLKKTALQYLTTDSCASYTAALTELNKALGRTVKQSGCLAHSRRKFTDALKSMSMERFAQYSSIKKRAFELYEDENQNFFFMTAWKQACDEEFAGADINDALSGPAAVIFKIIYLMDVIFYYEDVFSDETADEIKQDRIEYCTPIMNELFKTAHNLAAQEWTHITVNAEHTRYQSGSGIPWTGAVVYLLNNEEKLRRPLEDGRLDVHNSRSELIIRALATARRCFQREESETGYNSLAALMSLKATCDLNSVAFSDYLAFLIQELKHRLEEYRLFVKHSAAQLLILPKPAYRSIDKNGKGTGKICAYDPDFECPLDNLDLTGLTVWDYMALVSRRD